MRLNSIPMRPCIFTSLTHIHRFGTRSSCPRCPAFSFTVRRLLGLFVALFNSDFYSSWRYIDTARIKSADNFLDAMEYTRKIRIFHFSISEIIKCSFCPMPPFAFPLHSHPLDSDKLCEFSSISSFDWQLRYCRCLARSSAVHDPAGRKGGEGEGKLAAVPKWLCLGNGISDICLADKNHYQIWGREGQCPCYQIAMVWHLVWWLPLLDVDQRGAKRLEIWRGNTGDVTE